MVTLVCGDVGHRFGRPALFLRDRAGTVAVLFGLLIAPLTFMVGAALDYSGAANLKAHLQAATDGTGLRLCQIPGSPTQTELEDEARKMMTGYFGSVSYTIDSLTLLSSPRQIQINTRSLFPTAVVKMFGSSFATLPVTANARCFGEPQTFEIALVLDNTGSMAASSNGQSKIQALRTAATNFVNYIYNDGVMKLNTKISLVPFATAVAVNPTTYRTASWVDTTAQSTYHWSNVSKTVSGGTNFTSRFDVFDALSASRSSWSWAGCLESLPYPLNTQDTAPVSSNKDSYFVPMLAPDEAGDGGALYHTETSTGANQVYVNSYVHDYTSQTYCTSGAQPTSDLGRMNRSCRYRQPLGVSATTYSLNGATFGTTGPNFACATRPLTRLTTSASTLTSEISQMQPSGTTNIHEGFMWGWRTISPASVFAADAYAYNKAYNNKVIVLMTDGMNTWGSNPYNTTLKSLYSAYGYYGNIDGTNAGSSGRLPTGTATPANDTQARAAMDALTLAACQGARTAGVTIYTVGFSVASDPIDQQGIDMLKTCAGSASRAFVANDADALVSVFEQIAQNIGNLKLTN